MVIVEYFGHYGSKKLIEIKVFLVTNMRGEYACWLFESSNFNFF